MKRLFTLLLLSFAALSCEMIDEKLDDLLGKRDWVIFAEGTELTANVPSKQTVLNYKFESTLDWEVKTDAEWLEIDPMSGKAGKDIKIQIKVLHNKDKEGRTGYADLTLSNDESYRITINQAGEGDENNENDADIPNNQIWYTSTDGEIVEPHSDWINNYADALTTFGVNIVSNTYKDGKGVIEFEGDVTTIGYAAFAYCSSLTSVTIPDSVTTILWSAFNNCSSLTSVTIPDSVTTIGEGAFVGCSSLQEFNGKFVSEDGRCLIIDGTLNSFAPAGLTEYTIPDSVTTIGDYAFYDCSSLTSITIPDSVTTIGEWTFYNCTSLTSVTIPDSVTTIGDGAFAWCDSLTSVTIGDSVTTIGNSAFESCSSLTSVTIPDSITTIGDYAFCGCSSLTSVTIGDSVTSIGEDAFRYCRSLTSVTIPDSVTTIGDEAFYNCSSLTSVYCKATTPPAGGSYMFTNNASCRMIYVPAESVEAYKSAEYWRDYSDAIVAEGTAPEDMPTSIIRYTTEDGATVTPRNMNIKSNTYIDGEGVLEFYGSTIVDEAFYGNSNLTSVTIGDSVTGVGDFAFYHCEAITSVTLGQSVEYIGFKAFDDCISLTEITIPDSVQTIGVQAFCYCTSLSSFKGKFASEDGKCLIVDGRLIAFAIGSDDVGEYVIPDGVTEITNYSVYYCKSMSSLVIPDSVIRIGEGAFCDCSNLNSVTISDKVEYIGEVAFNLCHSLTSVYCKATTPPVAEHLYWDSWGAFDENASDRKIYVPAESVEAYKSAYRWSEYADDIVGYNF